MRQRITQRLPSPAMRCARIMLDGVMFRGGMGGDSAVDYIPHVDREKFFGSVDSWVAHMLLYRCGGCVGMEEDEVGR